MDDELHRRVAARIRSLARARGILVTHLPDRADVSRAHYFHVLACKKSPTLAWLERIAAALDVDPVELLREEPRGKRGPARSR